MVAIGRCGVVNFILSCLILSKKIGRRARGGGKGKTYHRDNLGLDESREGDQVEEEREVEL